MFISRKRETALLLRRSRSQQKGNTMKCLAAVAIALGLGAVVASAMDGDHQPSPDSLVIHAVNPLAVARIDEAVSISVGSIQKEVPAFDPRSCIVYSGDAEIPSQVDDTNRDGSPDLLTFVADFAPNEQKSIIVRWGPHAQSKKVYKKRTQADMSIKVGYQFVDGKYTNGRYLRIDSVPCSRSSC